MEKVIYRDPKKVANLQEAIDSSYASGTMSSSLHSMTQQKGTTKLRLTMASTETHPTQVTASPDRTQGLVT